MIPNTDPGIYASIRHEEPVHWTRHRVLAWDDDGTPLIAGRRGLIDPARVPGYAALEPPTETDRWLQVMPAGGWCIEYTYDDGATSTEPLIGWGLTSDGDLEPILWADYACSPDHIGDKYRIFHPDAKESAS